MSFLAPWFLIGAVVVGVPVWVHLIRRQQADPLRLPSLMFFRRLPVRTMSKQYLQHLLLLAARCLLVLLLALAFARPFFPALANSTALGPSSKLHVVLVDTSMSTHYGDRAERAKQAARDALARSGASDQMQLVAFDAEARILNPASADRGAVFALLNTELQPTAAPTRYGAAFGALEKIARTSASPIVATLITDSQKSGWTPGSEPPHLRAQDTLQWVGIDDRVHANWVIADVRVSHDTFQSKYTRHIEARVTAYGAAASKRDVIFSLNGREIQRRKVELPASTTGGADGTGSATATGGAASATATFDPFELPLGVSRGEIRLAPGDDLPLDDVRYFTVERRDPYRILFLSTLGSADRAFVYFKQALGSGEDPAFTVEARTIAQGVAGNPAAIVLFNPPAIPSSLAARLKQYPGGLLIAAGDRTDWSSLQSALGSVLPATSGEKVYAQHDQTITLGDYRKDDPLFEPFTGPSAAGLLATHYFAYFRVKANDADVIARYSTGDPAIVAASATADAAPRVLLFTSAPDNVWSDLPIRPGFVPLMNQAARSLARVVDEPAFYTVPATAALGDAAVVVDPKGHLQDAARFAKLADTGFYEVRRKGQTSYLAANPDARESDLTPMSPEDSALLTGAAHSAESANAATAADKPTREEIEKRQSIWWMVIVAAGLLAVLESYFGNGMLKSAGSQAHES